MCRSHIELRGSDPKTCTDHRIQDPLAQTLTVKDESPEHPETPIPLN